MDLVKEYMNQGYQQEQAQFLAGLPAPTAEPLTPRVTDPRPDLPGRPPGSVSAPRSSRKPAKAAKPPVAAPPAKQPVRTAAGRERSADIRAWAKSKGIMVSERGRIPVDVIQKYERAH